MKIKWDCLGGHSGTWSSSPDLRGMAEVNLLSAASVMFTGSTITELTDWSALMNLHMIQSTTFYDIQKSYLGPVIQSHYAEERQNILDRLCLEEEEKKEGKPCPPVHLSGDGRCVCLSNRLCKSSHYVLFKFNTDSVPKSMELGFVRIAIVFGIILHISILLLTHQYSTNN